MKKYFITGLLIWIPLVITIWVLKLVVDVLDHSLLLLPVSWQTENWLGVHIPGLGAILTIVIVFLTGLFATNFFGAQLVELWHEILHRIPVVNSIYSSVKQISDTLFSSSGQAFRKALSCSGRRRACGQSRFSPAPRAAASRRTCRLTAWRCTCRPRRTRRAATS